MTPRELVLMGTDENDTMGDEQAPAVEYKDDSNLEFMLRASLTLKRLEKKIDLLYELPLIVAAVERHKNERVY